MGDLGAIARASSSVDDFLFFVRVGAIVQVIDAQCIEARKPNIQLASNGFRIKDCRISCKQRSTGSR